MGTPEPDESRNGLIVLDELGSWLNSREFNQTGRKEFIDWMIHSRKKGWDILLICQHLNQIDKQIRESLVEYHVICKRSDRLKIAFLGKLLNLISLGLISGNMPKMHFGIVKYGIQHDSVVSDTWSYLGRDLYDAYDTRQIFSI